MKDYPNAFWAAIFIALGVGIAVIALYAPTKENVTMAVITIASNIISGSFGYIQGLHNQQQNPTQPVDPAKK